MKNALVLLPLALLATGCSPMLYPGYGRAMPAPYPPAAYAPAPPPLPVGRWDNVMRLPVTSTIDVLTLDGTPNVGAFVSADAQSLVIQTNGTDVRIARADVIRVDMVEAAGSQVRAVARSTAKGALLGAGASALVSAVIGGPAWPPPGVWLRTGAAVGGVAGAQSALVARQPTMVYLAPSQIQAVPGVLGTPTTPGTPARAGIIRVRR